MRPSDKSVLGLWYSGDHQVLHTNLTEDPRRSNCSESGMNESCKVKLGYPTDSLRQSSGSISTLDATLFIVVGFGGLSIIVALIHNAIHRYVFKDQHRLDTVFDAGGRVTTSLTAVTVASQVLWPVDLVQTSVIATIAILARFGKSAHIVYCCIAIATNIITLTAMIMTGYYVLEGAVPGISKELSVIILISLFGSYCYIGGLGAAFYISYFNTCLMFIALTVYLWHFLFPAEDLSDSVRNLTNINILYETVKCVQGPSTNAASSLLTFRTVSGMIYGIVAFFMVLALNCCDQAMWQSRIAAKPEQGVIGFFIASFLYFSIPNALALPTFLSYLSMSYQNGSYLLSELDMNNGFITTIVMEKVLGASGSYLLLMIVFMALMATGSGEVMAISSILVYDIYKTYIGPFRENLEPSTCPLCGNKKNSEGEEKVIACKCIHSSVCNECNDDIELSLTGLLSHQIQYTCPTHGKYRHYEDMLKQYKSRSIMWIALALLPYGIILCYLNLNLTWVFFVFETLLTPFITPLVLAFTWAKCTSKGLISGAIFGLLASIVGLLVVAELAYDEGLGDFFTTTSSDYSLLAACIAGIMVSTIVTVTVSLATHNIQSNVDEQREWTKMILIDNPINSWKNLFTEELGELPEERNVTVGDMELIFQRARKMSYICAVVCVLIQVVLVPGVMLSFEEWTADQLYYWMLFLFIVLVIGTLYAVFAPPIEEIIKIIRYRQNEKKQGSLDIPKKMNNNGGVQDVRLHLLRDTS
uniref:Putative urea active transporter 1 n=1 Tax=Magallana gigas TaxID=29159 RepID=K1PJ51_MAGGI